MTRNYYRRKNRRNYRKKAKPRGRMEIYGDAGSQLWRDVKYLKGLVNVETKFVSTSYGNNISRINYSRIKT